MNWVLIVAFLTSAWITVVSFMMLVSVVFGVPDVKEACLQSGGTSVEQPLGTFKECLK